MLTGPQWWAGEREPLEDMARSACGVADLDADLVADAGPRTAPPRALRHDPAVTAVDAHDEIGRERGHPVRIHVLGAAHPGQVVDALYGLPAVRSVVETAYQPVIAGELETELESCLACRALSYETGHGLVVCQALQLAF